MLPAHMSLMKCFSINFSDYIGILIACNYFNNAFAMTMVCETHILYHATFVTLASFLFDRCTENATYSLVITIMILTAQDRDKCCENHVL